MTRFARYPSLADRTVFITGGGSGIGAAMVEAFARQDCKVAFVDVARDASERLVASLGDARYRPLFIPCDLVDIEALRAAIARTEEACGPVAALVNNAASDERHEVDAVDVTYWDRAMEVNLRHQFFAAQAVRPQMRRLGGGSIINFSSIAWMGGGTRMIAYSTAKAGIVGMTRSLAREFGSDRIRVNCIAPGAVLTERQLRERLSESEVSALVARQCLPDRLLADEVARAALFLAADDSRRITKQCVIVDAGLL